MLFVDLLGVRALNRSPEVEQHLVALEKAVTRNYRDFLRPDSPWPAAFFSDTLVLASPVIDGEEESAIGGLVVQAAWLQLNLISEGFFVRGGLSIGQFHIREGLIFGPALVEAAGLESTVAVHPRIVLSRDAERSQYEALRFYADPSQSPQNALLLRDPDGQVFINYLALLFEELEDPRPSLLLHRDTVVDCLHGYRHDKRRWEKYRWVAEYHNAVVAGAVPGDDRLLVPTDEMTWHFESFV